MKRLSRHFIIALLAFCTGVLTHAIARTLFGCYALGECSPTMVNITCNMCDEMTKAFEAGTIIRPIPSQLQLQCWGVDEGKKHPPAQIKAHSRGN